MIYKGETTISSPRNCPHSRLTAETEQLNRELDNAIMTIIKKRAELVLKTGEISELHKLNTDEKRISECEKQIRQYVEQRQKYYEQFIQGEIDRDFFKQLKDECVVQIDKANSRLALYR